MPSSSPPATSDSVKDNPTIAVIGLGYVGLPLSLQFARSGVTVIGLDVDQTKIDALNAKQSFIKHIAAEDIAEAVDSRAFRASSDFSEIQSVEAVIICVPTPLGEHREPDISYVLKSAEAIAPHLQKGTLVVLESTTYPGTTEGPLKDVLEKGSGLVAGTDFHLAYSPEREDPGRTDHSVASIPKVVGGYTPACLEKAMSLYGKAVDTPYPVNSCAVAEACKLTENIFRSVNIALVNELKTVYQAMGIDVWEVIDAAATKPFGYMPFYPGPGLGGHCIPIDPFYLTWKAHEYGLHTRFIELAGEVNVGMPGYVVQKTTEALNGRKKAVNGSKVLILGLAYKANVDDMRESPTFELMDRFKALGAEVDFYDPHIPVVTPTREHADWTGKASAEWSEASIKSYDAVVIATHHQALDLAQLLEWADLIIDTRNAIVKSGKEGKLGQVHKA
jgi:UDP-N-acetyl-D-glucosamine dehydrogenase